MTCGITRGCEHVQRILAADAPAHVLFVVQHELDSWRCPSSRTSSATCCGFNAAFLIVRKKNTSKRGADGRERGARKEQKAKSETVVPLLLSRRRPFIGVTITGASLWPLPFHPPPLPPFFSAAHQLHSHWRNRTAVGSTDRKLQRHMLPLSHEASLHRRTTQRGTANKQDVDSCRGQNLTSTSSATGGNSDTSVKLCWRIYDLWQTLRQSRTSLSVCLSVWTHCALCYS